MLVWCVVLGCSTGGFLGVRIAGLVRSVVETGFSTGRSVGGQTGRFVSTKRFYWILHVAFCWGQNGRFVSTESFNRILHGAFCWGQAVRFVSTKSFYWILHEAFFWGHEADLCLLIV